MYFINVGQYTPTAPEVCVKITILAPFRTRKAAKETVKRLYANSAFTEVYILSSTEPSNPTTPDNPYGFSAEGLKRANSVLNFPHGWRKSVRQNRRTGRFEFKFTRIDYMNQ